MMKHVWTVLLLAWLSGNTAEAGALVKKEANASRVQWPEYGLDLTLSAGVQPAQLEASGTQVWRVESAGGPQTVTGQIQLGRRSMPCRIASAGRADLVQARYGMPAENRRINAIFNPDNDCVLVFSAGTLVPAAANGFIFTAPDTKTTVELELLPNYYREKRGVQYYTPIDKTYHRAPPSGWCSCYYYCSNVGEEDVLANAQWMAKELKDYGAQYIQLDDGWQGRGDGAGDNRDWFVIAPRFPHGMRWLADQIHALGLKAGLWVTPHGQSNDELFRQYPDMFLKRTDGSSTGKNPDGGDDWVGRYLLDTSSPRAQQYLKDMFAMFAQDWGYDYFKLDGQPNMPALYTQYHDQLAHPEVSATEEQALGSFANHLEYSTMYMNQSLAHGAAYRLGLQAIRDGIGPQRFVLGCGGTPLLNGAGLMNGSRTGADALAHWGGTKTALEATRNGYFLHNIVWYSDPDVLSLRSPLTFDQAQLWATVLGLSGQLLLAGDNMPALPLDRVELLRRVFPAADVVPLDLYPYKQNPRVWDTKVGTDAGQWDVVGVFNYDATPETVSVALADLGLDVANRQYVAYDFWNRRYLGVVPKNTIEQPLEGFSCRVWAVRAAQDHPQVISTSRHILQGAIDLHKVQWNAEKLQLTGQSDVIAHDPYEVRIALPTGGKRYKITGQTAETAKTGIWPADDLQILILNRDTSGAVNWTVTFKVEE